MTTSRPRSLYARLLGLKHLRLRPWASFVLLEGSAGLGVLLALADIVHYWAIAAIPIAVAAAVKLNDLIAGALAPVAVAPDGIVVGRSPVPRPARRGAGTVEAVVRGVASVPPPASGIAAPPTWVDPAEAVENFGPGGADLRSDGPDPRVDVADGVDGADRRPDGADRRSRGNKGRWPAARDGGG